jgi:hypothetical protein
LYQALGPVFPLRNRSHEVETSRSYRSFKPEYEETGHIPLRTSHCVAPYGAITLLILKGLLRTSQKCDYSIIMRGKSCAELFSWLCLMAEIAALMAQVTGLINFVLTAFL